jgi:pyrophosphate--fructose-6-phosphate 1-phosphotransferase
MSTIKNLKDSDPKNWICSGCPLASMMGMEKRKGKLKPVIVKYLVELDGANYRAYEQFRDTWSIYDCYRSPGPI